MSVVMWRETLENREVSDKEDSQGKITRCKDKLCQNHEKLDTILGTIYGKFYIELFTSWFFLQKNYFSIKNLEIFSAKKTSSETYVGWREMRFKVCTKKVQF